MAEGKKYQITINVDTTYLAEQSDPSSDRYVFSYTITIVNTGQVPAQLISRHWLIDDALGHTEEVKGLGVVGNQPLLRPGESFQYTSGSSTGAAATVGVQVSSTDYTQYSYNQAYIDPTVGTAILWYPSTQFTGKQAEYRFDEGIWNGTAGEVRDTSTATYNAVRVGAAVSSSTGKYTLRAC